MRRDRLGASALAWAGLLTWVLVSLPNVTLAEARASPRFSWWLLAWLAFGVAFWMASRRDRPDAITVTGLVLQATAVVTMVGLLCNGFEGLLLVLVAAQLGRLSSLRAGIAVLFLQTLAAGVAIALHWSLRPALMLMPPYLGFQLFSFLGYRLQASLADQSRLE